MAGTLDDLAALTGVSRATVSRVINGGSVSQATRERVMAVMERTGYRPNLAARTLASGRSGVVGVVMHVDSHQLFQDPYFAQLLQGMSDAFSDTAAGMMLWLGNRSKQETLDQILGMGLLEGVIVTAYNLEDPLVDGLLASSLPTVLVGHRRADRKASYVDVDHIGAADAVTSHLVRHREASHRPHRRSPRNRRGRRPDRRVRASDGARRSFAGWTHRGRRLPAILRGHGRDRAVGP